MTRFVVVTPNPESDIPLGLEQGAKYVLIGPDGRRAAFNDSADADHVGFLSKPPSGFDSPGIRESADVLVEGDGGVHGAFYLDRRPWTLEGIIDPVARIAGEELLEVGELVNRRVEKLKRASRALRADASLEWDPMGGVGVRRLARIQGLRIGERMPKTFLLSMVSADPRAESRIVKTASAAGNANITAVNDGNSNASPLIVLRDNWANPTLTNNATGEVLNLTVALAAADELIIDVAARTILKNGVNAYSALNFPTSDWWELIPGSNVIAPTGRGTTGVSGTWQIDHRDAWL